MRYDIYKFSKKEWAMVIGEYLGISLITAYLFYDSLIATLCLLPFSYFFIIRKKKELMEKRINDLKNEFIQTISYMATALTAGFSIDNSLIEAKNDIEKQYEGHSIMLKELITMINQISYGARLEDLLIDFSDRTQVTEIKDFATIFAVAKRSGGRFSDVIERCVYMMTMNRETERQIQVMISGKLFEQKIMRYIPFIIIASLKFTSPDFISVLYHNTLGIGIMTGCLIIYVLSGYLSERISDIKC